MDYTVLIVDDEKKFRSKYKTMFKAKGLKVLQAPDALEVVNVLMRKKSSMDLIILDICIPEVDGRGISEIVEEYAPNIPILVASFLPINDQKLKVRNATDYFHKLDKDSVLWDKVKKILGIEKK